MRIKILVTMAIAAAVMVGRGPIGERLGWVAGETITGTARVIDGDTVAVAGQRIRLIGVDAFEAAQECDGLPLGAMARAVVESAVSGVVECRVSGRDVYGRHLGRCRSAGTDLGAVVMAAGLAVPYDLISGLWYVPDLAQALVARSGRWSLGMAATCPFPGMYRQSGQSVKLTGGR